VPLVNLPPDVVRVLSFHGPVEVFAAGASPPAVEKVACAPFDDHLILFLRPGGAVEKALGWNVQIDVQARRSDGEHDYSLRMVGHAHPGVRVTRMPERQSLEPWLADGTNPGSVLATPFVPERIEFVRTEGDQKVRYHGPTPAGKTTPKPIVRWLRTATSGSAGLGAGAAIVLPFIWLGYLGADYPARPIATPLTVFGSLSLIMGTRLIVVHFAYEAWRAARVPIEESGLVGKGLVPARLSVRVGLVLVLFGVLCAVSAWLQWDTQLALVLLCSNLAWIFGPAWAVHLATSKAGHSRAD